MSPETLWMRVRHCFENDDGWFPTIELVELQPDEVGKLYLVVRDGTRLVNPDVSFWDYEAGVNSLLDDVPNAGLLVANRRAAPFAFAVEGIIATGIPLPNLGFQVFESVFAVHYQKGVEWKSPQVFAFFSWLRRLMAMTSTGKVNLTADGPPDPVVFRNALEEFVRN
jgi:hypothetical protein